MQEADYAGAWEVCGAKINCAVLRDKTRVVSETSMAKALGASRGGEHWKRKNEATERGETKFLPAYLSARNLVGFIDEDLKEKLCSPIKYKVHGSISYGIEATCVPQICEVYMKAREAGVLHAPQIPLAMQAERLLLSFAKIGIIAIVDEVTGYERHKERNELEKLLGLYLSEERLKWAKTFPDEFYKHIYRLKRWTWPPKQGGNHPQIVGQITNDIVYERLPKGVLEKLQEVNPVDVKKHRRSWKHHQFLTDDIGKPSLRIHLTQLLTLMRISGNWTQFMNLLNRGFPKGSSIQLMFEDVL